MSIQLSREDEQVLKPHRKVIRKFFRKKFTLREAKHYFLKNVKLIPRVIQVVVCKYLEIEICSWLLEND